MRYKTKERKLAAEEADKKLLELYFRCETFGEFKTKALEEHGYELKLLDPFWLGYMYVSCPWAYWLVVSIICALIDVGLVTLLVAMTGSDVFYVLAPILGPLLFLGYVLMPRHNRIISVIAREEHTFSEIYF